MKIIFASLCLLTMNFGVDDAIARNANDNSDHTNKVQLSANIQEAVSFENKECLFAERGRTYNGWYTTLNLLNEGKEFELMMSQPSGEPGSHQMRMRFVGTIVQISKYKFELYEEDGSLLGKLVNNPTKNIAVLSIGSYVSNGSLCVVEK
jgi:hypothetical protein